MSNIIAFPARSESSGSSAVVHEQRFVERGGETDRPSCPIEFGDLLKLPLDEWADKLDEIERHLRTLDDPRTRVLEEGVNSIRSSSTAAIESLRSAAAILTGVYDAIASSRDASQSDKQPPTR